MLDQVEPVMGTYLSGDKAKRGYRIWNDAKPGDDDVRLRAVRVVDCNGIVCSLADIRRPYYIEIEYEVLNLVPTMRAALRLLASDGTVAFTSSDSSDGSWDLRERGPGVYVSRCEIPGDFLNEGTYTVTVSADVPLKKVFFFEENVLTLGVAQTGGVSSRYGEHWPGVICPNLSWRVETL